MTSAACACCRVCQLFPETSYRDRSATLLGSTWQSRQGRQNAPDPRPRGARPAELKGPDRGALAAPQGGRESRTASRAGVQS